MLHSTYHLSLIFHKRQLYSMSKYSCYYDKCICKAHCVLFNNTHLILKSKPHWLELMFVKFLQESAMHPILLRQIDSQYDVPRVKYIKIESCSIGTHIITHVHITHGAVSYCQHPKHDYIYVHHTTQYLYMYNRYL